MDADTERALKLLAEAGPVPTGPVELSCEYLRAVARAEALPENRSGSDKSWVWELIEQDRAFFARVRQVR